ncbi:MAG: N-acetyltransferase [Flavobacterium sp.]|nr:MAG: N-acetyltransferase [Flavobacterium sp.]
MEIRDNTFQRQFETHVDGKQLIVEYSFQDRKIFLTRMTVPEGTEETVNDFIVAILEIARERKLKVVPIFPKIALFFRKNPSYRELLPPGIKL